MRLAVLCGALLAGGCEPGGTPQQPDETQALQTMGFTAPIAISADTSAVIENQGGPIINQNNQLLAALLKAGVLDIDANINSSPWWRFINRGGPSVAVNGSMISVPVAAREITGKSAQQSWSEGSIRYFAETIGYNLKIDPRFTGGKAIALGPFSVRLVMAKDPAVGQWGLLRGRGTQFDPSDASGVPAAVAGDNNVSDVVTAIRTAQRKAFDIMENYYKTSGKLARDEKRPDVLVSRQTNLAYLTSGMGFSTIRLADLDRYCEAQGRPGYGRWRPASRQDIVNLTAMATYDVGRGGLRLPDTPDNRLWGRLFGRTHPALITSTYERMSQNGTAVYVYSVTRDGYLGENSVTAFGSDPLNAPLAARDFFGASDYRILCVTDAPAN